MRFFNKKLFGFIAGLVILMSASVGSAYIYNPTGSSGGGGGGTIGGTIASGEVGFGSALNTLASDPNLLWNNGTQTLSSSSGGNGTFSFAPGLWQLGYYTGGGSGIFLSLTDATGRLRYDTGSTTLLDINSSTNLASMGDPGVFGRGTQTVIDNTTAKTFKVLGYPSGPGPVSFTGSGLNDLVAGGSYTGTGNPTVTITIASNETLVVPSAGGCGVGDTLTDTTTSNTASIIGSLTAPIRFFLSNVSGPLGAGHTITCAPSGGTTTITTDTIVDTFNSGGILSPFATVTGSAQTIGQGRTITLATTGHTVGDFWTFSSNSARRNGLTVDFANKKIGFFNNYFFPFADGTANQVLATDGSGNISWANVGTGTVMGSGIATQVAFWSSSNTLGNSNDFLWDNANKNLSVGDLGGSTLNARELIINQGSPIIALIPGGAETAQLYLDGSNNTGQLGWNSGAGNKTFIKNDDPNMHITAQTDDLFDVQDSNTNRFLHISLAGRIFAVGDYDTRGNGQADIIDDSTSSTIFRNQGLLTIQDGMGIKLFTASQTTNSVTLNGAVASDGMQVDTGGGATIADGNRGLYYDPASLEASATITLPANPIDGQEEIILFGGTITGANTPVVTALTISAGAGETLIGTYPTAATTDTVIEVKFRSATSQWYRID